MKLLVITAIVLLSWATGASAAPRYDADSTRDCLRRYEPFGMDGDEGDPLYTGDLHWWFSSKDDGEVVIFFTRRGEALAVRTFRDFRHRALALGLTAAQVRQVVGRKGNAVWGPNEFSMVEEKEAIALHAGAKIRSCLR